MYYLSIYPFVAALPLQSWDEGPGEDESTQRPSKSKSERSSKRKKKISKLEKRKAPHSPEQNVSPFLSISTLYISKWV